MPATQIILERFASHSTYEFQYDFAATEWRCVIAFIHIFMKQSLNKMIHLSLILCALTHSLCHSESIECVCVCFVLCLLTKHSYQNAT